MRIAYGVMGYGRGHSTRSMAVLSSLAREHDVTVFAGGDAHSMLAPHFPTVEIPSLGYAHGGAGGVTFAATVARNAGLAAELMFGGASLRNVVDEFRRRDVELVISDSEAFCHRAARRLGIPRISFDHVGVIAWCKPHFPPNLAWRGRRDGWGYRTLMGEPDRVIISSFYPAQPMKPSTRMVGPMLRREVHAITPRSGEHLLAYFNRGHLQYSARIENVLRQVDAPIRIYGTSFEGTRENLEFRPIDPVAFLHDVAAARAVIATAGNQLIGELLHFRKPILALPERVFEQQLNAWMVERMGIGRASGLDTLTVDDVAVFLGELDACAARTEGYGTDGTPEALDLLRRFIDELRDEREHTRPRTATFDSVR
ncbi:MAG: hypothetical protein K0Q76_2770 [Panacagrimonas sp.]|nr:glycosyltransferase family protein [Panacagrimonas sp.]MCC2657662.1 hypothetical protein [Panacagrimonas sp.]